MSSFGRKKALSCVKSENEIYCCYKVMVEEKYVKLNVKLTTHHYKFGMHYFSVMLEDDSDNESENQHQVGTTYTIDEVQIDDYVMLLPKDNRYTAMTSNWKYWNENANFQSPHKFVTISDEEYRDTK
jgi:hypothetical protein